MEHVTPLSTGALAVLREMESLRSSDFIFSGRKGAGQSSMTMLTLLQKRMGRAASVHGFRSAFRDWCGDEAGIDRELAEAALGHTLKSQVERSYRRKSAVQRRSAVMQQWCDYILPSAPTEIVSIEEARRGRASAA
jgi:integrase